MTDTLFNFSRRSKIDTWPRVTVRSLCKLAKGDTFKPTEWSTSGLPIIRTQNLNDSNKPFNYWNGSKNERVLVDHGDVLIACSNTPETSLGAHIWTGPQGVLDQHIFRVDFTVDCITPEWFVWAVNLCLEDRIVLAEEAGGRAPMAAREFLSLLIALPPFSEQKRIAALIDAIRERMTDPASKIKARAARRKPRV